MKSSCKLIRQIDQLILARSINLFTKEKEGPIKKIHFQVKRWLCSAKSANGETRFVVSIIESL